MKENPVERQKEIETQREIIMSLTLQLREKDDLLSEAAEKQRDLEKVQEVLTSSKDKQREKQKLKGRYNW